MSYSVVEWVATKASIYIYICMHCRGYCNDRYYDIQSHRYACIVCHNCISKDNVLFDTYIEYHTGAVWDKIIHTLSRRCELPASRQGETGLMKI